MHDCQGMGVALSEGAAVVYIPEFREYGIRILDGGSSFLEITDCPWCGAHLPPSLRDQWFDELERLGLEPGSDAIPEDMKTDAWWKRDQAKNGIDTVDSGITRLGQQAIGVNVNEINNPLWKDLQSFRGKTKTNGATGKDRHYYEREYPHRGDEVYDSRGNLLGIADPETWDITEPHYEQDYPHGRDVEVYDSHGMHLGSMDPETGDMTKPVVPGRKIDV